MNKIEKDLLSWQQREQKFAATYPKGALDSKAFQKVKHKEMMRLYRKHQGTATSPDERVNLAMLRAANRGMEKQFRYIYYHSPINE